jgi:hypothetical protein
VIEALDKLNSDRKCFRLVNGVLVEKTVGEVLPQLKNVHDNVIISREVNWFSCRNECKSCS